MSRPDLVAEIALIPEDRRFGRIIGVIGGGLPRRRGAGGQRTVPAGGYASLTALLAALR